MGRIGPIHRGDGPSAACPRDAHITTGLRRDGALAGMDCVGAYGARHVSAQSASPNGCHNQLTALLAPLNERPDRLASRLLYRFGSIGAITQASENELRQVAVDGEKWVDAVLMVRRLMHVGMREELIRTKLGEDRRALFSYLLMTLQNLREERMIAIFADAEGYVIAEEVIAEGGDAHVLVTPRRIFGRAMNLDARRILLAHNHPSGCAKPSTFDIDHTQILCRQARELGMLIEDHLVIGGREVFSMKDRGLL